MDGDVAQPFEHGVDEKLNDSHALDGDRMRGDTIERGIASHATCTKGKSVCLCKYHGSGTLSSMHDLEELRELAGVEAKHWTTAQLEQLRRDIDVLAALLLDFYEFRRANHSPDACGLPPIDVPQTDR